MQTGCHYLNIKEQSATSYMTHSELMKMQDTHECIIRYAQTLPVH